MVAGPLTLTHSVPGKMKIAIIGAGAGGLCALRHSLDDGHECEVFEQTEHIGGTWVYCDQIGIDSYGLPVHSSMYRGLTTNLPKELMAFEDFPYTKPNHSFLSQPEVLRYMNDYAKNFNLLPHIKFLRHVTEIKPLPGKRWCVKVMDLRTKIQEQKEFDAVIIAVGNYSTPRKEAFPGMDKFEGRIMHSHDYRVAAPFKNRRVLIVGGGPSGVDIARILNGVAKEVILSCRSELHDAADVEIKPEISQFGKNNVKFTDNSEAEIDDVIICTGYLTVYPFLTKECDITTSDNWIKYLYKHCINAKHPTMAFLALPNKIPPFVIVGIQTRFFLAMLNGQFSKTEAEMVADIMEDVERKRKEGLPQRYYHRLGIKQKEYVEDLATTAGIKRIAPVICKMYTYHITVAKGDRTLIYKILNDEEFSVTNSLLTAQK